MARTVSIDASGSVRLTRIGGSPGPALPSTYRGRLVAHTATALPTSSVAKGTDIDAGCAADAAGYAASGASVFAPADLPAETTGWMVVVVEGTGTDAVELTPSFTFPVGGGATGDQDYNAEQPRTYWPIVTDTGTVLRVRVETAFSRDDEAATGYRRGWTFTLQGGGIEPASEEAVYLRFYETKSATAVGSSEAQLNALKAAVNAKDAAQDAAINALENREATGGTSTAEVRQLIQGALATALAVYARTAWLPVLHLDATHRQLAIDWTDQGGTRQHTTITYGGTGGGGGITDDQAINATLSYLASQLTEFTWDATARTLSFSPDAIPDGSLVEAKLAQALQDKINAALHADQVETAARADVPTLSAAIRKAYLAKLGAQAAIDNDTERPLAYVRVHDYTLRQGRTAGEVFDTGLTIKRGDISIMVEADGLRGSATILVPDWDALPTVGIPTNVALTPGVDSLNFALGDNQQYVAKNYAGTPGEFSVDLGNLLQGCGVVGYEGTYHYTVIGSRQEPFADTRSNAKVPKSKLPDDTAYDADVAAVPRPGPAFVNGAVDVSRAKFQDMVDSFKGGSWADVTGNNVPKVSLQHRATPFTPADIGSLTFAARQDEGPRFTNEYIVLAVPITYTTPLAGQRLRIGDNAPDAEADRFVSAAGATLLARSPGQNYYLLLVDDKPSGSTWGIQALDPWSFNTAFVKIPDAPVVLLDGAGAGIAITSTAVPRRNNLTLFSPNFDLDDNANGIVMVDVVKTIASASVVSLGFTASSTAPLRVLRKTGFTTLRRVREAEAYLATQSHGVELFDWRVYNAANWPGDVPFRLARQADTNLLGYYEQWDVNAANPGGDALQFTATNDITAVVVKH